MPLQAAGGTAHSNTFSLLQHLFPEKQSKVQTECDAGKTMTNQQNLSKKKKSTISLLESNYLIALFVSCAKTCFLRRAMCQEHVGESKNKHLNHHSVLVARPLTPVDVPEKLVCLQLKCGFYLIDEHVFL